jgi:hypothetical protein
MAAWLRALAGFRYRPAFDKKSVKTIAMLRQTFSKSVQFWIALSNANPGLYDSSEALGDV